MKLYAKLDAFATFVTIWSIFRTERRDLTIRGGAGREGVAHCCKTKKQQTNKQTKNKEGNVKPKSVKR